MKGRQTRCILFIFWMSLAILATLWIIISIFTNIELIFIDIIYQFVLLICVISMIIAVISLKDILSKVKVDIKNNNDKQKVIRDYYQYNQLLDPPIMNN